MNGESCGGSGSNLVVAKVNNGTWNWAKQTGGQSKAVPLADNLIYKNSSLYVLGGIYPCTSDSTKQVVIGSTTIQQQNNVLF